MLISMPRGSVLGMLHVDFQLVVDRLADDGVPRGDLDRLRREFESCMVARDRALAARKRGPRRPSSSQRIRAIVADGDSTVPPPPSDGG